MPSHLPHLCKAASKKAVLRILRKFSNWKHREARGALPDVKNSLRTTCTKPVGMWTSRNIDQLLLSYYLTSKATSRLQQPVVQDTKTELVADREAFSAFWRCPSGIQVGMTRGTLPTHIDAHNLSQTRQGKETAPLVQVEVCQCTPYNG